MPTRPDRISVADDAELAGALDRAAIVPPGTEPATRAHDLAVRGADAMLAEHRPDPEAIERAIALSTRDDLGFDPEVLANIDRLGWRLEP
jgi:hypothetical protein